MNSLSSSVPLVGLLAGFVLAAAAAPAAEVVPSISLPDLVAAVTTGNPELKFYEAEVAAARGGRQQAGSRGDTEVALEFGRKRVRDAAGGVAAEGGAWSVSVLQTFDWPGRLALRKALANQQVTLAELGLERFRSALAGRARLLGYGLYAAQARADAIAEVAGRFAALKETLLARDPAGITPLLEIRVIEANELAIQRRATEAQLAVAAALVELNQLRGAAAEAPLRIAATRSNLGELPAVEALLTAAYENNFEFRLRRAELEQQGFAVQLARHERRPAITAGPTVSGDNAGGGESFVGFSLSLPVAPAARSRGAVEAAEARRRQAEISLTLAQRELEKGVRLARLAFDTHLAEVRRWAPDSVGRFREAAELADRHYRLAAVPIGTYVELQQSYITAIEALLDTERDALEARLQLRDLTGLALELAEAKP